MDHPGRVVARFGARLQIRGADGTVHEATARRQLRHLVCGDRVRWRHDGHVRIITAAEPRCNSVERRDRSGRTRVIAANVDQIVIVVSVSPPPADDTIDRYLVAAGTLNASPLIVVNKIDLPQGERFARNLLADYAAELHPRLLTSAREPRGVGRLSERLRGRTSILVGQSGTGKSSLLNAVLPEVDARVGELTASGIAGRHTTTVARLFALPGGGTLIDSPGIREFGLPAIDRRDLEGAFPEFEPFLDGCRFRDCTHDDEPDCAVRQAVAAGRIPQSRHAAYRKLLHEAT